MATTKTKSASKSVVLDSNGYRYYENIADSGEDDESFIRDDLSESSPKKNSPALMSSSKLKTSSFISKTEVNTNAGSNQGNITENLDLLEFEAGLKEDEIRLARIIRIHCHASYIYACAQATFFVGNANKLRRNMNAVLTDEIKPQHILFSDEMSNEPGLRIGIIGGGRLCRQLTTSLMEYGGVKPSELHISTRQPETLYSLKNMGIECVYNNSEIARKVNILFLCVLPSKIQEVVDDIKTRIPKWCIVYSFVRTIPLARLRNLIDANGDTLLLKPDYEFNVNENEIFKNWNYSLDTLESLSNDSMMCLTNPLHSVPGKIMHTSRYYVPSVVYALINICIFLKFNKKQTLAAISGYVFNTTFEKKYTIDETLFFEKTDTDVFQTTNLVKVSIGSSRFSNELEKNPELSKIVSENYVEFFRNITKWKNAYKNI